MTDLLSAGTTAAKRIAVRISAPAERIIRDGHPWLFEGSIKEQSREGKAGDLAVIFDRKRRFLAVGLYDPHSPIRIRILQHGTPATIDEIWFGKQIEIAAQIRTHLPATQTTGYRLVHGENDGLPGLVVDRYADTLVVKIYTLAWAVHLTTIVGLLIDQQKPAGIILRLSRQIQAFAQSADLYDGMLLFGTVPREPLIFQENGLLFEAAPVKGQKTGFFLDQRDNRQEVAGLSAGKRVLNVFAYTGGFSIYAARGGAAEITNLDISRQALEGAKRNLALNLAQDLIHAVPHHVLCADASGALADLHKAGRRYDLVVIDPPSLAKKREEVEGALRAYARLAHLGLAVLAPRGTLAFASCSSRVDADSFFRAVHRAADQVQRSLNEIKRTAHPIDHPIRFKEGAYLKCIYATA